MGTVNLQKVQFAQQNLTTNASIWCGTVILIAEDLSIICVKFNPASADAPVSWNDGVSADARLT